MLIALLENSSVLSAIEVHFWFTVDLLLVHLSFMRGYGRSSFCAYFYVDVGVLSGDSRHSNPPDLRDAIGELGWGNHDNSPTAF